MLLGALLLLCTVLLGDFIFHHVDGAPFKFLPDLFFFALPRIFDALAAVTLVLGKLLFDTAELWYKLQVE